MRPGLIAVGAGLLVLGAAVIAIAPMYAASGLYRYEFSLIGSSSSGANYTKAFQTVNSVENQSMILAFAGAAVAASGGGVLAFGLASRKPEAQSTVSSAPVQ